MNVLFCKHLQFGKYPGKFGSCFHPAVFLHFPARYQQYATRGESRFQHPEALPHQPSCPVADNRQQTVFFAAYNTALQTVFRRGGNNRHHSRGNTFDPISADLLKLCFETQFFPLFQAESDFAAAIRDGRLGRHVTPDQAVSRARPF